MSTISFNILFHFTIIGNISYLKKLFKTTRCICLITLILVLGISTLSYAFDLILKNTPTQVFFSPKGGCSEAIINQINSAKSEILVQAYSFTSTPIAKALRNAPKRGVKVEAILDKSQRQERYTSATFIANSGIPTYVDDRHTLEAGDA